MDLLQFSVMNAQDTSGIYPAGYDVAAAKEKGLFANDPGEMKYQQLQAAYLAVLNRYLEDTIDLQAYETLLQESGYNFYPIEDNLYYSYRSYGRNNLYLRNNAYIERLNSEQLELLMQAVSDTSVSLTPELMDMVTATWKDVITVYLDPNSRSVHEINYEMDAINSFSADSNALTFVIGFCKEFDEQGNTIDSAAEQEKFSIVLSLIDRLESEASRKLDCPVKAFLLVGEHCG